MTEFHTETHPLLILHRDDLLWVSAYRQHQSKPATSLWSEPAERNLKWGSQGRTPNCYPSRAFREILKLEPRNEMPFPVIWALHSSSFSTFAGSVLSLLRHCLTLLTLFSSA